MNKKKYISVGVFFVVVTLGVGIAYYIAPSEIDDILGINSGGANSVADADSSAIDAAPSSFSSSDTIADVSDAPSAVAAIKKPAPNKKNTSGAVGAAVEAGSASGQEAAMSPSQNENSSSAVISDQETISLGDEDAATATLSSAMPCSFPSDAPSTTKEIILNEIAWMGSVSSSNAEWLELKNNASDTIGLSGWEIMNASEKFKVRFSDGDTIPPGGFFLLARASAAGTIPDARIYSGDLANAGDALALVDPQCGVSDYLDASRGWPAGNNTTKATMERDADGNGWHTSALPGGTPGAENSAGPPPAQYRLTIGFDGDAGGASIASDPAGLICAASCTGSFVSGTQITLTPESGPSSAFIGWSGLCYGKTACSFAIAATMSLTADFRSTLPPPDNAISPSAMASSSDDGGASGGATAGTSAPPASPLAAADHILIAAVQIAGPSSDNDLVTLYNPTGVAVDMSGWKLHKRSQTGTDYSLKVFPAGSVIAAAGSFTWANSEDGFSETAGANVSSTETLSADNSVALLDAPGNVIDAVAWGIGSSQYGEGPPYPTSPGANQLLSRRSSGGVMEDTENNAEDFTIQ